MKQAFIRIERDEQAALGRLRQDFLRAAKTGKEQGSHFSFDSPATLFRLLSPTRWVLIETLQRIGPSSVRGLARELGRDVRRVHDDVHALLDFGLIEKDDTGRVLVPFEQIHAEFDLGVANAA